MINIKKNFLLNFNLTKKKKFFSTKKIFLILTIIFLLLSLNFSTYSNAITKSEIEENLSTNIDQQLNNIDFSKFEEILQNLENNQLFNNSSFKDKVKSLLNGTYYNDYGNIFSCLLSLVFNNVLKFMPILLLIISICLLNNLIGVIKSENESNKSINNIIAFISFSIIVIIIIASIKEVISTTQNTIESMQKQMQVLFPITLTLLTAVGGASSVSIYKPLVAVLINGIPYLFNYIVYPVFIISFIFVILNNLSNSVKLNKFIDFLSSFFKWSIGIIFTIFSSFLTLQGISAGRYDGVSIKATKFAIKSYIPIIGGYLSEGLDFVVLSSILIKNAIGMAGLLIIFITIISPVIQILIFKLGLQLTSAVVEPLSDGKSASFINQISKVIIYPLVLIIGVAFMYILSLSLIMCTGNI